MDELRRIEEDKGWVSGQPVNVSIFRAHVTLTGSEVKSVGAATEKAKFRCLFYDLTIDAAKAFAGMSSECKYANA